MSHNIMYLKIFLICFSTIIIYLKPIYSLFFIILFYNEYFYTLYFIYFIKNSNYYEKIEIKSRDFSSMNNLDIWFFYCQMNAFLKIYVYYTKNKKINFISIFKIFIIYLFNVPYKFLKLLYYFVFKNKDDFRTGLLLLTIELYDNVKGLRIEILNNKIYLNCVTIGKAIKLILKSNEQITKQQCVEGMAKLKTCVDKHSKIEGAYGRQEVKLAIIYDKYDSKPISNVPHYTIWEKDASIHGTSNVNFNLRLNQRVDGIIADLVKENAVNPGTIITKGVSNIKTFKKGIWVHTSQINIVKANHVEFAIDDNIRNYQKEKEEEFESILQKEFKLGKNIDQNLLRGFRYNEYNNDLNNMDDNGIKNVYDHIIKEIKKENDI